jgi:hypothetical protein
MSRSACDRAGNSILAMFGHQDRARYSVGGFTGDMLALNDLVDTWWQNYKAWEATDTLADAYREQRLTVKGTSTMSTTIQAFSRPADPERRYAPGKWDPETPRSTPIVKTNASIMARTNPEVFVPRGGGHSRKTELGYHDLSALLVNPAADISAQQYKTISDGQVFAFMPLSTAMDQAVFQNINTQAKANHDTQKDFYDKVRRIRSELTRIKLAAEHDMATKFVEVGQAERRAGPKYKYTLSSTTDISIRDEGLAGVKTGNIVPRLTVPRLEEALKLVVPELSAKQQSELVNVLPKVLRMLKLNMLTNPAEFAKEINDRLFYKGTNTMDKPDWTGLSGPKPTEQELKEFEKTILDKCGGKTAGGQKTTPGLLQARQNAAINFQALVLGQIMRYGEVTIAYRRHAGNFPKFAKFDKAGRRWIVGTVDKDNKWIEGAETFADRPV